VQPTHAHLHRGCTVLPALIDLTFFGVDKYLGDIVDTIDAPLLELVDLRFSNDLAFEILHLSHFIRRTSQLGCPTYYTSAVSVSLTDRPRIRCRRFALRSPPSCRPSSPAWECSTSMRFLRWRVLNVLESACVSFVGREGDCTG
jgi:hypothetical protein